MTIILALLGAVATGFAAIAYRRAWHRLDPRGRTPTGFGALLGATLAATAWASAAPIAITAGLAAGAAGALIYWFDDAMEMSARVRLALAALVGGIIGAVQFVGDGFDPVSLGLLIGAAAFVNVALVNSINMQDGADLNLALLLALTGAALAVFGEDREWVVAGLTCLAFAVGFGVINFRPRSLYFGDSGCFALATLFTVMGAAFLGGAGSQPPPPEAAIPLALPMVDMAFVTAHRISIRQRFTVRHYFHLYQRLQTCRPGFAYLAPQIVAAVLALGLAFALQAVGVDRLWAVVVGMGVSGLLTFWAGHAAFVSGEPGPPPQRTPA